MANIVALQQLGNLVNIDYSARFNDVLNSDFERHIPQIGESIPKKADGTLKYTSSMTPIQRKKALAISGLVASVLTATIVVITAILLKNPYMYLGLIPAVVGGACCIYFTVRYSSQLDLASPKQRQKEIECLRTDQLSMSKINKRYGNFSKVVAYALLGNAPLATYQQAALLCSKQAAADHCYNANKYVIRQTYEEAIKPAKEALERAERAQMMATSTMPAASRTAVPATVTAHASYDRGYAQAEYKCTVQEVMPTYDQALAKLNQAYQAAIRPISSAFQQLPLS